MTTRATTTSRSCSWLVACTARLSRNSAINTWLRKISGEPRALARGFLAFDSGVAHEREPVRSRERLALRERLGNYMARQTNGEPRALARGFLAFDSGVAHEREAVRSRERLALRERLGNYMARQTSGEPRALARGFLAFDSGVAHERAVRSRERLASA